MPVADHVKTLLAEADEANHRRLVALQGDPAATQRCLETVVAAIDTVDDRWVALGDAAGPWSTLAHQHAGQLLGRTVPGLVIDARDGVAPNAIGQTIGAVAGGGLVVLLTGDPSTWVPGPLTVDDRLAAPPYARADVANRFRARLQRTLLDHPGVAVVDADTGAVTADGSATVPPGTGRAAAGSATGDVFGADVLDACRTGDQRRCVIALEALLAGEVVVVESHRGRGKSSAAGIAAGALAGGGEDVLVTGPGTDSVREVFARASEGLDSPVEEVGGRPCITAPGGGRVVYRPPHAVEAALEGVDHAIVDEAAAVPIEYLRMTLDAGVPVAYLTTVHGYEGTGRGFAVRFADDLEAAQRPVHRVRLREPIRYAAGDPIEAWQFRALLLDASPPPAGAIDDATPAAVRYVSYDRDELLEDEATLREAFGLLVLAHYRTEPDDLWRLLDAPNIAVHALEHDGHPVSVALVAEEGDLSETWRERVYAGEPITGHMIPDLLTTQLRDRDVGALTGRRVLRIATHEAVRSRGLGAALLERVADAVGDDVDWLGAGFGATPRLLEFWAANGYRPIHLGTSRNPRSGEHSAVVLAPTSAAGRDLYERHRGRLLDRLPAQLTDALRDVDPALVASLLRHVDAPAPTIDRDWSWAVVQSMPHGPGTVATAPAPFRALAMAALVAGPVEDLEDDAVTILVERVLQGKPLREGAASADRTYGDAKRTLQATIEDCLAWVDAA